MAAPGFFIENLGNVTTDTGTLAVAPEHVTNEGGDNRRITDERLNAFGKQLAMGGDGDFLLVAVYSSDQTNNLPKEYRIVVDGKWAENYEKSAVSSAQMAEHFRQRWAVIERLPARTKTLTQAEIPNQLLMGIPGYPQGILLYDAVENDAVRPYITKALLERSGYSSDTAKFIIDYAAPPPLY